MASCYRREVGTSRILTFLRSTQGLIALGALIAIGVSLICSAVGHSGWVTNLPLWLITAIGGGYLLWQVLRDLANRTAGVDVLAGIAIVAAAAMGQWLVAAIVVLMLSGGEGLEAAATARASAMLDALAKRAPSIAHRIGAGELTDVQVGDIGIGDRLMLLPHELCPVDGEVVEGHGTMDESYLTGEPYLLTKSVGSAVMSGAINGDDSLQIIATKVAADSRYASIVGVLTEAEHNRPPMRRLADRLGVWYTVIAVALAVAGWAFSGEPSRFLAVIVIATPCPLLLAVPVAIIGAISISAKAGIIIKDPGVLERLPKTHSMLFDKTGTLTYGRPVVSDVHTAEGRTASDVLPVAAALELYSRHPLAAAVVTAAGGLAKPMAATQVAERPGQGLAGQVGDHAVRITSHAQAERDLGPGVLPPPQPGMSCVVLIDGDYGATIGFRDEPRADARDFIAHLRPRHKVVETWMISGDRSSEVEYVAQKVGIDHVRAGCSPEEKLELVRELTEQGPTTFLGDGINDAPAMTAASAGIAFGTNSDVTSEAAAAVVLDSSLERLDELLHIAERMRRIALQSAIGGIVASSIGMGFAVAGALSPVAGALLQEVIDILAILNAARVAMVVGPMADYSRPSVAPRPDSAGQESSRVPG